MLRAGRIAYTNDLPIYCAFDVGAERFPGTLLADVPTALNARLLGAQLDLSPVSAFFYARHADRLALLPELCIGSRDQVWSVTLVSAVPPEQLDGREIAVTRESASGRNLLAVLLTRRYGVCPKFVDVSDPMERVLSGRPALLIGDRALDAQRCTVPEHVYDLGSLWHEWTGEDMVYAVWAVRRDVLCADEALVASAFEALYRSRAWGMANMEQVIAAAQRVLPRGEGFYAAYYRTLNFAFDERARSGLRRFIAESVTAGTLERACSVDPEPLRVPR
ncbi:MAG: menaquinone biosynthesis protein [Candidatus Eremiobacteraeota bacterium]|nr:menaquinone biosynthesis protein [Candidatus Eremiobacteraeota bacterium]